MAIWPARPSPAQARRGPGKKRPSPTWPDGLRARAGQHYGLRSQPSTSPRLIFRAGPARGTTTAHRHDIRRVWRREIVVWRWRRWPMAEEGGEEGTGGGMGGADADISGSCSTSTGAGIGGPCSTSTATVSGPCSASSLRTAVLRPRTSSPVGRDPRCGAVSARLATRLAPAGMHCLPRPAACRCGRRWLPRSRLALAGGAGSP
jgi:hypothetical protein